MAKVNTLYIQGLCKGERVQVSEVGSGLIRDSCRDNMAESIELKRES